MKSELINLRGRDKLDKGSLLEGIKIYKIKTK